MIRKVLGVLAVVLVVMFIARNPIAAGAMGRHLGSGLTSTADGIGHFFVALTGGK